MIKRIWTKEEEEILKENYLKFDQRELSEKFFPNKTPVQICQKKMCMGLKGRRKWSEEERSLLLEHGANYNHKDMHKKFLPNKTPRQITDMRKYFGIRRCKPQNN
jgi:hypothetical protein